MPPIQRARPARCPAVRVMFGSEAIREALRKAPTDRGILALMKPGARASVVTSLAALALAAPGEAAAWQPDVAAAKSFAESRQGAVSFAVLDTRRRLHEWGEFETTEMASTVKVMLLVAYLRRPDVADRPLTRSERALLRPMIRRSDNDSATVVRDMLGRDPVEELARDAGMEDFVWSDSWGHCRTSPADQARFMRRLENLVPERHLPFAKRLLSSIIERQSWGLGELELNGWKLYFKGGWGKRWGVDHQIALLTKGERRIGISIYSTGQPSREYGAKTVRGVGGRLLRGLP